MDARPIAAAARVRGPVSIPYRYELRRGADVVATGHISFESPLEVGERVTIGRSNGIVQSVTPTLEDRELQLVVQLLPSNAES